MEDKWIDLKEAKEELLKENQLSISDTTKNSMQVRNETLENAITQDYTSAMGDLQQTTDYKEIIKKVVEEGAKTKLESDMLSILNDRQKNELAKYALDCQKEQLEYRKKKEKKLIKEQVNADIIEKQIEIQKKKYGYLYKADKDGNLIDFVPNSFVNKFRAVCHWYANLGGGIKKVLWTTIKIGLIVGGVFLAVKGMSWLANSGILENLKK